jgi:predicted methyltransferase
MLFRFIAVAALMAFAAAPALAQAPSRAIAAAIASPARPANDRALDASRRPAALIAFAGIKPGDRVMDVWPGAGYWTRIFSKLVGADGQVYAYVPSEIAGFAGSPVAVIKAVAADPAYGNVVPSSDPLAEQPPPEFQNMLDVVWTFENYHDLHDSFMKGASVDAFNRAAFKILKPGGVYIIVDHAAPAGSGLKHTEDLHRIDPATVRSEVEKAGFIFAGESRELANPADPRTALVFKPEVRGKTDRFVYKFRKPE